MFPIPAHDTVQTPPGRHPTPRPQHFRRDADPDFAVRSSQTLSSAIREIYAGNAKDLSHITLYGFAPSEAIFGHGEALYTHVAAGVGKLAASLDHSAPDAEFLRELLSRWKKHSNAVAMIGDEYMGPIFVRESCKAPVRELGLRAWRDRMLPRGGKVWTRLQAALLRMAGRERAGEAVDAALCELLAGASNMLVELGHRMYREVFEVEFLHHTRCFYARESVRLLDSECGCGEYLRAVESMIDAERARASRCLDARTREKVVAVVMGEMLENNVGCLHESHSRRKRGSNGLNVHGMSRAREKHIRRCLVGMHFLGAYC